MRQGSSLRGRIEFGTGWGGLRFNPTKNESTIEFARSANFFFCVAFVLDKKKMEDLNSFLYQKKKLRQSWFKKIIVMV